MFTLHSCLLLFVYGTLTCSQCSTGHFTTKINWKYRLWYNVSVPYPKPGLAENTGNVELRAAPLVQHYSVFSARPDLGYGTLIHCIESRNNFFYQIDINGLTRCVDYTALLLIWFFEVSPNTTSYDVALSGSLWRTWILPQYFGKSQNVVKCGLCRWSLILYRKKIKYLLLLN